MSNHGGFLLLSRHSDDKIYWRDTIFKFIQAGLNFGLLPSTKIDKSRRRKGFT
jgi:hypothetical protein